MPVLARLGCGHLDDFTGAAFDDDEAALPQRRALLGVRVGRASVALVTVIHIIFHASVGYKKKSIV